MPEKNPTPLQHLIEYTVTNAGSFEPVSGFPYPFTLFQMEGRQESGRRIWIQERVFPNLQQERRNILLKAGLTENLNNPQGFISDFKSE